MNAFKTVFVPAGTHTEYKSDFHDTVEPLTIGVPVKDDGSIGEFPETSIVIAILCDSDGDVYEWMTTDTNLETAVNFATDAEYLVVQDFGGDYSGARGQIISAMLHERALYADCFHHSDLEVDMPEEWTTGKNPKFTSRLAV